MLKKPTFETSRYVQILLLIAVIVVIHARTGHGNVEKIKTDKTLIEAVGEQQFISPSEDRIFDTKPTRHIGYGGETPLRITVSPDNIILNVELRENNETPAFIRRITKARFFETWNDLDVGEAIALKVDAITGSTMTTQAIINTFRDDLTERIQTGEIVYDGDISLAKKSFHYYLKMAALLLVLVFALFSLCFPKKANPYRIYLLGLSVTVLGFWQGQYLSVTHFINWSINGIHWTVWFIPLLAILSVLLPLFTRKSFYCMYICPYGAAQELASKLNKKHRLKIPDNIFKFLKYIQAAFIAIILLLLFTHIVTDFVNFEPFAAFSLDLDMPVVLILAGSFLILSVFIPRFWCKYFCPTGFILNLFR